MMPENSRLTGQLQAAICLHKYFYSKTTRTALTQNSKHRPTAFAKFKTILRMVNLYLIIRLFLLKRMPGVETPGKIQGQINNLIPYLLHEH
jgi:hypothetical protein